MESSCSAVASWMQQRKMVRQTWYKQDDTLPQGHVWFSALAQRPQSPAWHRSVQVQRPHCSVFMHGWPHWKSRSSHDLVSVVLPHLQL